MHADLLFLHASDLQKAAFLRPKVPMTPCRSQCMSKLLHLLLQFHHVSKATSCNASRPISPPPPPRSHKWRPAVTAFPQSRPVLL